MVLQSIWFFLWGLLWAVFFMTDGFDFGIGTLYPFIGKSDTDKKIMLNSIGPVWDGNEVWLIAAGGVTFAAFPMVYARMFSSLYTPLMLILFALILRGAAFKFRNNVEKKEWKNFWDIFIFLGNFLPALIFGIIFANIFQGIPFGEKGLYYGNTLKLLNPYGLLGGILFVLMFTMHGTNWLIIKTRGELQQRAVKVSKNIWLILVPVAIIFLGMSYFTTDLYANYLKYPGMLIIILIMVSALSAARVFIEKQSWLRAWFASALTIGSTTFFGIAGLFPVLLPSNVDKKFHLTAFNASSSPLTLKIMLGVTIVFIPIVIGYQIWAYNLFKHPVIQEDIDTEIY